jgi:hypothetical protein
VTWLFAPSGESKQKLMSFRIQDFEQVFTRGIKESALHWSGILAVKQY